jgi:hypothetical protein
MGAVLGQMSATGAHLLQVGEHLFQQGGVGKGADHRHFFIHQGQGGVLELTGGVGHGLASSNRRCQSDMAVNLLNIIMLSIYWHHAYSVWA